MPESSTTSPPPPLADDATTAQPDQQGMDYLIEVAGAEPALACHEIGGFQEALVAAGDALAHLPSRLVLTRPDGPMRRWLARWAEDDRQVRRSITVRSVLDAAEVTVVATLASYGRGVETTLAVESVAPAARDGMWSLVRSGVHPKAMIEAVLREMEALEPEGCEPGVAQSSTDP